MMLSLTTSASLRVLPLLRTTTSTRRKFPPSPKSSLRCNQSRLNFIFLYPSCYVGLFLLKKSVGTLVYHQSAMGQTKSAKRNNNSAKAGIQQQISTMFGEKVKKPRMYMGTAPPVKPGEKPIASRVVSKNANESPVPMGGAVASQKRRWRLSELVKKEREDRVKASIITPSFVFEAPHMDTRRPLYNNNADAQTKIENRLEGPPRKKVKLSPDSVKYIASNYASVASKEQGPLGADALLHDRSMLPKSHALLLDVLQGLESAISLLRTRKVLPTVGAVREIVSRSTHRTFTLRILSQLANIVPEAVAVLPGLSTSSKMKRPSTNLIIRLDCIDTTPEKSKMHSKQSRSSELGDSPARMRRSLLHKRLLSHVRQHHERFLQESKILRYNGSTWHPDFDIETKVPELHAPPLYPMRLPDISAKRKAKVTTDKVTNNVNGGNAAEKEYSQSQDDTEEDHKDVGIPSSLLERVRAREKERSRASAAATLERTTNRSLLTKLPCTMDTILSILRSERRSAIGWLQLLTRLEKFHPQKWRREDLDEQLTAITDLASTWCRKVELKSSRGGYAFRVISADNFRAARDKVGSTTSYSGGES